MTGFEKMSRIGRTVERSREDILKRYLKMCPTFYHICYDPLGTHKKSRSFIGFLMGIFLGIIFYRTIIFQLKFDRYTTVYLGSIIILILSIGCATSVQIRCICILSFPAFFGRAGRIMLRALILGYIIAGPIFNMTYNGKEVIRSFACTAKLTYNLTKTRADLMFEPFHRAILEMRSNAGELKDALSSVRDLMSPIVEEIEGEEEMMRLKEENDYLDEIQGDSKRSEEIEDKRKKEMKDAKSEAEFYSVKYKMKVEARCEEQLSRGAGRCRDMFADAYDKCYNKVSVFAAWLLCWPMKLTFVCNLVQALGGANICDPDGQVDVGVGDGYVALKNTRNKFSESLKDAKLQYKLKIAPPILDIHDAATAAKAIMYDFNVRRRYFESVMIFAKRCLSLIFLKIILNAQKYHDSYLTDIEFDNIYVTRYFRKIDARRKARGSITLLPLKKAERTNFIDPYGLKTSKAERQHITGETLKLLFEIIIATSFILMDRLFFEALDLIRRHSRLEFTQVGHHDLSLQIKGTGVIASLIRHLINGFNVKKHTKTVITNAPCLPRPTELPSNLILQIYCTFLAVFILIYTSAYTQRTRFFICSFFYRTRQKRRILYLYNESLRRRHGYVKFTKAKIIALARTRHLEQEISFTMALRKEWPKLFGWLKLFESAREKCLVCGEVEPRRGIKFRRCTTPGCPFVHCEECWRDIGQICYACADVCDTDSEEPMDESESTE
ncbi:protein sneaky-like [Vespula pensylvanica]|uniref:Dendritic cell-specific transmembrane protein-like domain-containing protein n=1 Tax=Vespula pensylvanica TaxID=30213 RepID=A0A834NXW6_VESPE|nr:protein sneaky-like [Vespula pensylvanica]KAF7420610.1 hypothetical protein H0235_010907 [Vespula pensylvanica]